MPLIIPMIPGGHHLTLPSSSSSSSSRLVKTLTIGIGGYCAAWGLYYLAQETLRASAISKRKRLHDRKVSKRRDSNAVPLSQEEEKQNAKEAIQDRFAPLCILGRYVNPFAEWREQGAWEFLIWKSWGVFIKGRLWYDGGIRKLRRSKEGMERIQKRLPLRIPQWEKYPPQDGNDDKQPSGGSSLDGETKIKYTWVGQSTMLISYAGTTILTDPVFEEQPVPTIFSPRRITEAPCSIEEITSKVRLDYVLITHNHFDHFDIRCIPSVPQETTWIVPLGMRKLLRSCGVQRDDRIVELTWWEMREFQGEDTTVTIQSIPAIHWSGRGLLDVNQSLWTSYSIQIGKHPSSTQRQPTAHIFFSGDTGYSPTYYPTLSTVLPSAPDLAFLPIGSYAPRWHMRPQHVSPEDSVMIADDIRAKKVVAMHWGTWIMSDEEFDDPPEKLREALESRAMAKGNDSQAQGWFEIVELGQTNELAVVVEG